MLIVYLLLTIISSKRDTTSFVIVNVEHPNHAVTLFNYNNTNTSLPLRLSQISDEKLESQLFNFRFVADKRFWVTPIKDKSYMSLGTGIYLAAYSPTVDDKEPNLYLKRHKIDEFTKRPLYTITYNDKCLAAGKLTEKNNEEYYPLLFEPCDKSKQTQQFAFVSRIESEKFLKMDVDDTTYSKLKSESMRYLENLLSAFIIEQ